MREIKFRAWHHGAGDLRVVGDMRYCNGNLKLFFENVDNEFLAVEVMQYTGLKDKNGVEIYEGDVLTCEDFCDESDDLIVVNDERGCFIAADKQERSDFYYLDDYDFVVVGNIHQNPELLKQ